MGQADYQRLLTEAYDIDKPTAPADELAYYLAQIASRGEPVLEVMSGSGRFLFPLLAAGVDIDGVDASADMLAACERRCQRQGLRPRLFQQRVERLQLPRRYPLAFCGGGSFGLIANEADVASALRRLYEHLMPGGWLLLEVETPAPDRGESSGTRWWDREDGAKIVMRWANRYDPASQVVKGIGVYELFVDGRLTETELNDWVCRYWQPPEIIAALADAGLVDIAVHKAFTTDPPRTDERTLSVIARRPRGDA